MNKKGKIRSFIAIELPSEVRDQLRILLDNNLKNKLDIVASWVKPENCHLTLKFLGDVPPEEISRITNTLISVTQDISPFSLRLDKLGVFPNIKHPRILWIGIAGDTQQLISLHNNIDSKLKLIGFPSENRAFAPHLTLCRIRENLSESTCKNISDVLNTNWIESSHFQVSEIVLFRSELTPKGPIHSRLATATFKKAQ